MTQSYDFKLIKSGKEIEIYEYKDKEILRGYRRRPRKERTKTKPKIGQLDADWYLQELKRLAEEAKDRKEKTKFSISRTRTNIRRLANANSQLKKFLTLTFARSTTELKQANNLFNQAIKRIIRSLPDFEYIAVVEFQKDVDFHGHKKEHGGSVHYHLLCNLVMPITKNLKELFDWEKWFALRYWKNGFIKIKQVEQINNLGAYFCKYLGKDMTDTRMFGKKKFFCSQTLNKPVELTGYQAVAFCNKYLKGLKPTFKKTFVSEYAGEIEYSAYTLPEELPVSLNIDVCDKKHATQRKVCFGVSETI